MKKLITQRANFISQVRGFFNSRQAYEVDINSISNFTVTSPHIDSIQTYSTKHTNQFLLTSPEMSMKKLLALGAEDIFYLGKAYRDDFISPLHATEFTMLEWYRVDKNLAFVIDETIALIKLFTKNTNLKQLTYQECFHIYANITNIFETTKSILLATLSLHNKSIHKDYDMLLDELEQLVWSEIIEPQLDMGIVIVTDHPAKFSDMAKSNLTDPHKSIRFELYLNRVELANGYEENCNQTSLKQKFATDNSIRCKMGKPEITLDETFIKSIGFMPECSGVALGIDRLFKIIHGYDDIADCDPLNLAEQAIKNM